MLAIIAVQQFPPRESFKSLVNFESQYGICHFYPFSSLVLKALIQFPRESKDQLIFAPSINLWPQFYVAAAHSLPARSIKFNFADQISSFPDPFVLFSTVIINTACDLLLTSFAAVLSVVLHLFPSSKDRMISSAFVIINGSPVTQTPLMGSSLRS